MQTNPETKKPNRTLLYVAGGCVVLFLCIACLGISIFIFRDQILAVAGMSQSVTQLPQPTSASNAPNASPIAPVGEPTRAAVQPSSGNPFLDALTKAKSATKYRVEFAMIFGGTDKGQYKETPFIAFNGEIDGKNSHINSTGGLMSSMMTGSETGKLEITEVNGTEYMKGASSLFGVIKLDPNTWYISTQKSASTFAEFAKPDEFGSFTGSAKSTDFSKVGTELVDAQPCDVYLYDMKSAQNQAMVGLLGSSQDKNAFGAIDKAEIKFWLCGDGFVHKYSLNYEGHDPKNAADKGAMKMNWHVWDVNNPLIVIQAPAGAKPMPTQ